MVCCGIGLGDRVTGLQGICVGVTWESGEHRSVWGMGWCTIPEKCWGLLWEGTGNRAVRGVQAQCVSRLAGYKI